MINNWQPQRSAEIIQQQIGNETLLLDSQGRSVHVLNATALIIWRHCDGNHAIAQIEAALHDAFAISAETDLTQDVNQTLTLFHQKGLIN